MSDKLPDSISEAIGTYTWLFVDALLLLFLLAGLLSYGDFDEPMRVLFRGAFLAFWAYVWISGLHLLVYLRRAYADKSMPAAVSYSLFGLKLLVVFATILWACRRGLL